MKITDEFANMVGDVRRAYFAPRKTADEKWDDISEILAAFEDRLQVIEFGFEEQGPDPWYDESDEGDLI